MAALVHFTPTQQVCFISYQGVHRVDDVKLVFDELEAQAKYQSCFRFLMDLSLVTACDINKEDLRLLQSRIAGYAKGLPNPDAQPLMLAYFSPTRAGKEVGQAYTGQWNLNRYFISMTSPSLADCTLFLAVEPICTEKLSALEFDLLPRG